MTAPAASAAAASAAPAAAASFPRAEFADPPVGPRSVRLTAPGDGSCLLWSVVEYLLFNNRQCPVQFAGTLDRICPRSGRTAVFGLALLPFDFTNRPSAEQLRLFIVDHAQHPLRVNANPPSGDPDDPWAPVQLHPLTPAFHSGLRFARESLYLQDIVHWLRRVIQHFRSRADGEFPEFYGNEALTAAEYAASMQAMLATSFFLDGDNDGQVLVALFGLQLWLTVPRSGAPYYDSRACLTPPHGELMPLEDAAGTRMERVAKRDWLSDSGEGWRRDALMSVVITHCSYSDPGNPNPTQFNHYNTIMQEQWTAEQEREAAQNRQLAALRFHSTQPQAQSAPVAVPPGRPPAPAAATAASASASASAVRSRLPRRRVQVQPEEMADEETLMAIAIAESRSLQSAAGAPVPVSAPANVDELSDIYDPAHAASAAPAALSSATAASSAAARSSSVQSDAQAAALAAVQGAATDESGPAPMEMSSGDTPPPQSPGSESEGFGPVSPYLHSNGERSVVGFAIGEELHSESPVAGLTPPLTPGPDSIASDHESGIESRSSTSLSQPVSDHRAFWAQFHTELLRGWLLDYQALHDPRYKLKINGTTSRGVLIDHLTKEHDLYARPAEGVELYELQGAWKRRNTKKQRANQPLIPGLLAEPNDGLASSAIGKGGKLDKKGREKLRKEKNRLTRAQQKEERTQARAALKQAAEAAKAATTVALAAEAARLKAEATAKRRLESATRRQSSRQGESEEAAAAVRSQNAASHRASRSGEASQNLVQLLAARKLMLPSEFAEAQADVAYPRPVVAQDLLECDSELEQTSKWSDAVNAMHNLPAVCVVCDCFITDLVDVGDQQPFQRWPFDRFNNETIHTKLLASNVVPPLPPELLAYYDLSDLSPYLNDLLLSPDPAARDDLEQHLFVCLECASSLNGTSPHPPRLSIANNNAIGVLPDALADISWPEKAMTLVWCPRACIVMLQNGGAHASRGHVISVEMNPGVVASKLPVDPLPSMPSLVHSTRQSSIALQR